MTSSVEIAVGRLDELADPGCREFVIGEGDWPFRGFVVRSGNKVYAYQNSCSHLGHSLNWMPDRFLSKDNASILCASHGAQYEIDTGLCFAGPCVGKSLRSVDVEIRDDLVYVTGPSGT